MLKKIPDLNERKLISQMHFCLPPHKVPCTAEGQYFIADQVWVKYDEDGVILDMIIIDTKLSSKSGITDGQVIAKQNVGSSLMFKRNEAHEVNQAVEGGDLPAKITQGTDIPLSKFYILEGNGTGSLENVTVK